MKTPFKNFRNDVRWRLHCASDWVYGRRPVHKHPGRFQVWLAIRLDRLAMLIGGPLH